MRAKQAETKQVNTLSYQFIEGSPVNTCIIGIVQVMYLLLRIQLMSALQLLLLILGFYATLGTCKYMKQNWVTILRK